MRLANAFAVAGFVAFGLAAQAGATELMKPDLVERPTSEDVARYYPPKARAEGLNGWAMIGCHVAANGRLEACAVVGEDPIGAGFGGAALKLARHFRVRVAGETANDPTRDAVAPEGGEVRFPIRFVAPGVSQSRIPPSVGPVPLTASNGPVATTPPVCPSSVEAIPPARQAAEAEEAVRALDAAHDARLTAIAASTDAAFQGEQRAYAQARLAALRPLAARGNADAMFEVAKLYRVDDGGFHNPAVWHSLIACASDLGSPAATSDYAEWTWHEKGDGSFAAIQTNRARAMGLAAKAASLGDFGALHGLGVYIGGGDHQYPRKPEIARNLLTLCGQAGGDGCRWQLVNAAELHRGYELDPSATWRLEAEQARTQPGLYNAKRDALWATLTPTERQAATRGADRWAIQPWSALAGRWDAIMVEILAHGCPASAACILGTVCTCTPAQDRARR